MKVNAILSLGAIGILFSLLGHGVALSSKSIKLRLKRMFSRPIISPEASMSTVHFVVNYLVTYVVNYTQSQIEMIKHRGYRAEAHRVTTEDSYVLELHRILPAASTSEKKPRKVVYLHHGMVLDGHIWIVNSNENSLAYMLVDRGYDVWLGNSRGTRYSRQHLFLDAKQEKYWDFG